MPINYPDVLKLKTEGVPYSWSDREVMLYALGIGMGNDPLDEKELLFVNEGYFTKKPLKVVPTFASVCVWGANPGHIDVNRVMSVDGERDITFHKPMPATAKVYADSARGRRLRQGQGQGRGDRSARQWCATRRPVRSSRRCWPRPSRAAMAGSAVHPRASPSRIRSRSARRTSRSTSRRGRIRR